MLAEQYEVFHSYGPLSEEFLTSQENVFNPLFRGAGGGESGFDAFRQYELDKNHRINKSSEKMLEVKHRGWGREDYGGVPVPSINFSKFSTVETALERGVNILQVHGRTVHVTRPHGLLAEVHTGGQGPLGCTSACRGDAWNFVFLTQQKKDPKKQHVLSCLWSPELRGDQGVVKGARLLGP